MNTMRTFGAGECRCAVELNVQDGYERMSRDIHFGRGKLPASMWLVSLVFLWSAVVMLSALVGWYTSDTFAGYKNDRPFYVDLRFEPAVAFAAIGVCVGCFI